MFNTPRSKTPVAGRLLSSKQKSVEAKNESAHLSVKPRSLSMGLGLILAYVDREPEAIAIVDAWQPRFKCSLVSELPEHRGWE